MKKFLFVVLYIVQISAFSQDLIITNYSGATTFDVYEEFTGEITVKNTGIVPVNNYFYLGVYLSADNQLSSNDSQIGTISVESLDATQSYTGRPYWGVIKAPPGIYYLIIKADDGNRISETDESNNHLFIPNVIINPPNIDFTFTSFSLDKSAYSQNSMVKPSYIFENLGSTNTGGTISIQFRLSTDAIFDQSDIHLHTFSDALTGTDRIVSSRHAGFVLPSYIEAGSYYIVSKIDSDYWGSESFEEINKNNNTFVISISINSNTGDLEIYGADSPKFNSGRLSAYVSIVNKGATGIGGYSVGAQLIQEGELPSYYYNPTDYLDHMDSYIEPNQYKSLSLSFSISHPTPGTYYAVYSINYDYSSPISSSIYIDYSNPIMIGPPPVRAVLHNQVSVAGTVNDTDLKINLNLNLTNTGNTRDFGQLYAFQIRDDQNRILHSQNTNVYINFNPEQTEIKPVALNLSSPLPIGSYNIRVSCPSACYTTPSMVSADFTVVKTPFKVAGVVQGEDGKSISKGKLFLYKDDGLGNTKFVQKIDPYIGPGFLFSIDTNPHTLYFIPDPIQFPEYVPTILGKTFILQENNFFTASENTDLIFEVLKVQDIGTGTGVINGYITSGNSPVSIMAPLSSTIATKDIPVMLISQNNHVIGISYTDEAGFYEFKNLPRDTFQILIGLELDNPIVIDPFEVDISGKNMVVNFELKSEGVFPNSSQLFLPQEIIFGEFTSYQYGTSPIQLNAHSNTGVFIEYSSSDENIAKIVDNNIYIKGVGTVLITAKQPGNTFYLPASVSKNLTIDKGSQIISFDDFNPYHYGDPAISLHAQSNVDLPMEYVSSDEIIAKIVDNKIYVQGVGSVVITAKQTGNSLYLPATLNRTLNIGKGIQIITLDDFNQVHYGDDAISLYAQSNVGLPIEYVSSDENIATIMDEKIYIQGVGSVVITAKQSGNTLYLPANVNRTLNIDKGTQIISMDPLVVKKYGDTPFEIKSSSTSGLPVKLSSSDPTVASINVNTINIHKAGKVNILAEQYGSDNYYPALSIVDQLAIEKTEQIISFNALPNEFNDLGSFFLEATASSELDVYFESSDEEVISITGNSAHIYKAGTVYIKAYQYGNQNYLAADPVVQELVVNLVLGIKEFDPIINVFPNPTSDYVIVGNNELEKSEVYDVNGRIRMDVKRDGNKFDFSKVPPGIYFLKVSKNKEKFIKIIKK